MPNPFRPRLLWWVGAFVAVTLLAVLVPTHLARSVSEEPQILVEKSVGGIRYGAYFDPVQQGVIAEVSFDYFSPEGVEEYITFNRTLSEELARRNGGPLRVIVHFSRPLAQEEFEAFVERYGVQVHSYFMRAVEADGWRAGIGGSPEGGQLVPQHLLDAAIGDIAERNSAEFEGWISANVTTDPMHLGLMQRDPDIVLTEVSHVLIYEALTTRTLRQAGASRETIRRIQTVPDADRVVQITGPGLYWHLEDLGLVSMPTHSSQK